MMNRAKSVEYHGLRAIEKISPTASDDDIIDHDIVLIWSEQKRIITGADLFGRLMRGITRTKPAKTAGGTGQKGSR